MNRRILTVISTQTLAQLGNSVTIFSLGALIFAENLKVSDYTLLYFFQVLPGIICLLPAGILVDNLPRRLILFMSDFLSALLTLVLFFLIKLHVINSSQFYIYIALLSIINSAQGLALVTVIANSVNSKQRHKTAILMNLQKIFPRLLGPFFAGNILVTGNLDVAILFGALTFLASSLAALTLDISNSQDQKPNKLLELKPEELFEGINYIISHQSLRWLLICLVYSTCVVSLVGSYVVPVALLRTTPNIAGNIISIGGFGAIIGSSLYLIFIRKPLNLNSMVPFTTILQGIILATGTICSEPFLLAFSLFLYFFIEPIQKGLNHTLWQEITPTVIQGRVFSYVRLSLQISSLFIFLLAGILADEVLEPLFQNSIKPDNLAILFSIYGSQPGSGMLFALSVIGIIQASLGIYIYYSKKLERNKST